MRSEPVGERGIVFTFNDPYHFNTYVILGNHYTFIFDTFCGPDAMREVLDSLDHDGLLEREKRRVVINSHYHYDHIWGNSSFAKDMIMAHVSCIDLIREHGHASLKKYGNHAKGQVELTLPNFGFTAKVLFPEEDVLLFHSPGHTEDGISCFDMKDNVLLVGDNVESPIPFLYQPDISLYIQTLENYLNLDWKICIASHDPIMRSDSLTRRNLDYLTSLAGWDLELESMEERALALHLMNLGSIASTSRPAQISSNAIAHYKDALRYINAIQHLEEREEVERSIRTVTG
ncbi:MAG: MBL fold metallo-hydrolase [Candidatus Thorarchaeota archaeon]|nr:MBL fold metallo-hydrolase [Candidatus Thorarchaeota archaeon]